MTIPLVLLHGVGLDHSIWDPFRAAYDGQTYAYDLRGHGNGPAWDQPANFDQFSADLTALIDQNGWAQVNLCGFSMGAMVALHAAQAITGRINRLILLASVYKRSIAQRMAVAQRLAQAELNGPSAIIDAALSRWFAPDFPSTQANWRDRVAKRLNDNDPAQFLNCYRFFATADDQLPALAARVHQPTLIIAGGQDQNSTPQMATDMAQIIPNAQHLVYQDAAHMIPLHDPTRLARDLHDFVTKDKP